MLPKRHEDPVMTNTTSFAPSAQAVAIPIREVASWAIFGSLLPMLTIYFVDVEEYVREFARGAGVTISPSPVFAVPSAELR